MELEVETIPNGRKGPLESLEEGELQQNSKKICHDQYMDMITDGPAVEDTMMLLRRHQ